jgi:penicillin-binding protein 1A
VAKQWIYRTIKFTTYGAAAVIAGAGLFYALTYLFGAIFAYTSGSIIEQYPVKLQASLATNGETYIPYSAIPRCAIDGAVSVEDKRFFLNPGIDPIALVRVALASFNNDHQDHGGSTITQQLARIMIGEPRLQPSFFAEFWSEVRVIKYGLIVEHDFSKEKILELYFNSVYYGRHAHGFADAAKTYFHTDPVHLTQAQCYYLTGLPQAPSYFGSDPAAAAERYQHVLRTLERNGYITKTEALKLSSSTPKT